MKKYVSVQERIPDEIIKVKNFENLSKEMATLMESQNFAADILSLMHQDISDDNWDNIPQVSFIPIFFHSSLFRYFLHENLIYFILRLLKKVAAGYITDPQ